ncbi:MAG: MerR family transcriptional regulator [Oscillospiraceae bacterium]|nr:MerR family transcriptional regulator [Oscillospiraceae bacterium]
MEYTVNKLSKISGVSARTLRYYDEIGLLKPVKVAESGYRIYSQDELNTLQEILFYRELGFPLEEIKHIVYAPGYDRISAFHNHLDKLVIKRKQMDSLIDNVTKSISAMKGEITMTDTEKFEGFKQSIIDKNEKAYGHEIREKYGDSAIDASNAALKGLSQKQYDEGERLRAAYEEMLKNAVRTGDPSEETAQAACDLHRQWLCIFYPNYSKEYHKALGEMYATDERFRAYYEKITSGCAEFFRDSINIYCKQ